MAKIDYDTVEALAAAARLNGITLQRWNRKRMRVEIRNAHTVTVRKRIVFALIRHVLYSAGMYSAGMYSAGMAGTVPDPSQKFVHAIIRGQLANAGITVPDLAAKPLLRGYLAWELSSCS